MRYVVIFTLYSCLEAASYPAYALDQTIKIENGFNKYFDIYKEKGILFNIAKESASECKNNICNYNISIKNVNLVNFSFYKEAIFRYQIDKNALKGSIQFHNRDFAGFVEFSYSNRNYGSQACREDTHLSEINLRKDLFNKELKQARIELSGNECIFAYTKIQWK